MSQFLPEEGKRRTSLRFQGIMGTVMGLFYVAIAVAIGYMQMNGKFENGVFDLGTTMTYVIVVVFILYGIFRFYRGLKAFKEI